MNEYTLLLKINEDKTASIMVIFEKNFEFKNITNVKKIFNKMQIELKNKDEKKILTLTPDIEKYLILIKECYITNEDEMNKKNGESIRFNI